MIESVAFGMAGACLYLLWLARAKRASGHAPQLPPKELPFRTAGTVDDVNETWGAPRGLPTPPLGPLTACPRCGARQVSCGSCHGGGTDKVAAASHDLAGRFCGTYHLEGRCLNFTHGTSDQRLCSPDRRARYGFLWLRVCEEPGIHVHQKCERCAWRGIARIEKPTDPGDELGPLR